VTSDYTLQSLSLFAALSVNRLRLRSGAYKANGNIKIAHEYIDVVYYFPCSKCCFRELGGAMGTCAMFRLNRTE